MCLFPLLYAVYTSLRPYAETAKYGYFSWPRGLTFANYTHAWQQSRVLHFLVNTLIITVPSLVLILLLSSFVAFGLARFGVRGGKWLLIMFTAGNLLPQQILVTPLYQAYRLWDDQNWVVEHQAFIYDTYWGVIAIHVAFQIGFCTFVLTNYMQTLPHELTEAALVDGAGALAAVLDDHDAAVPAAAGRAGDAGVHLDLQRLPLGAGADEHR